MSTRIITFFDNVANIKTSDIISVKNSEYLQLDVTGTANSFKIKVYAQVIEGGEFLPLAIIGNSTFKIFDTIIDTGFYRIDTSGILNVRLELEELLDGSITCKGTLVSVDGTGGNSLQNIEDGEAEGSIQSIGIIENPNLVIGEHSLAFGVGTKAGCKGYYFSTIDFNNADGPIITLEKTQGIISGEIFEIGYAVGDKLTIISNSKYEECATIKSINNNLITVDTLPFSTLADVTTATDLGIDDFSLHVPTKPEIGEVILAYSAFAEGEDCVAIERASHAEGRLTSAYGQYSHAEGRQTLAYYLGHAEGYRTKALGFYSHAEGRDTTTTGGTSHAEGYKTVAEGEFSHSEGKSSQAKGESSHAEGQGSVAEGKGAHAEGQSVQALGAGSHAEGHHTVAEGGFSHVEGNYTIAKSNTQHVQGSFNVPDEEGIYAHIVGNGNGEDKRSNAHTLDWDGNAWFAGKVMSGDKKLLNEDDVVGKKTPYGEIFNDYTNNKAQGQLSHAEGKATTASSTAAHSEGWDATASGLYTHAEGAHTTASGTAAHAEGVSSEAKGYASHAEGYSSVANGDWSHAEGRGSVANGKRSHAEGASTADGEHSHAEGQGTTSVGNAQHVQGKFNKLDTSDENGNSTYAHIVGNGTSGSDRSNAYALDWNGNAYFAGDVYVGDANDIENAKQLVTQEQIDKTVEQANENTKKYVNDTIEDLRYYDIPVIATDTSLFEFNLTNTYASIIGIKQEQHNGTIILPHNYIDGNGKEYIVKEVSLNVTPSNSGFTLVIPKTVTKISIDKTNINSYTLYIPEEVKNITFTRKGAYERIYCIEKSYADMYFEKLYYHRYYINSTVTKTHLDNIVDNIDENLKYYGDISVEKKAIDFNKTVANSSSQFTFETDENTMTASIITGPSREYAYDVLIPYKYIDDNNKEYIVTSIREGAFDATNPEFDTDGFPLPPINDYINLSKVIVPNTIISIESEAFHACEPTFVCIAGSYADTYAKEKYFNVEYTNEVTKDYVDTKISDIESFDITITIDERGNIGGDTEWEKTNLAFDANRIFKVTIIDNTNNCTIKTFGVVFTGVTYVFTAMYGFICYEIVYEGGSWSYTKTDISEKFQ